MVQVNASGGFDGVSYPAGWSDQVNLASQLESGGGGGSLGSPNPATNGYLTWSVDPEDCTASVALGATATSFGWLTKVTAGASGPAGHLDMVTATGAPATITGCVFALYNSASFATGPLAWTASKTATQFTAANTAFSFTWDGASSPTAPQLISGQNYWIYTTVTFSSTGVLTLAGTTAANAPVLNPNLTASASVALNSMTLSPAPVLFGAVGAASVLAPQTTWAASTSKLFFGLRA